MKDMFQEGERAEGVKQSADKTDVSSLLEQLMAVLQETFNPNSCLPEYKKAYCLCLPFYCTQQIVAGFFGRCYKNSKQCRSCYRRTKILHQFCWRIGLYLYVIVFALIMASGLLSLLLKIFSK